MCTSIRIVSALCLLSLSAGVVLGQGGASGKPALVINEFMAQNTGSIQDSHGDYDDWIELYNYGGSAVDVAGFYLTDDLTAPTKWRILAGDPSVTTIGAHGFLLIWADQEAQQGLLHANFKLSAGGESLGLSDAQGNLLDSLTFGAQEADVSSGRVPDGTGQWQSLPAPTPGKSNQAATANVIISEIMFHPPHAASTAEDRRQEWIELFNAGAAPANLAGWQLSDGVQFVFPDVVLGAGEYLVVAADTSVFSARHPGVTNIVGDWIGWLSNSGERIQLVDEIGQVINEVRYADEGDWAVRELGPVEHSHRGWQWSNQTDDGGKSLEVVNVAVSNEVGQNWAASSVDGGTPGRANSVAANDIPPVILKMQHSPLIPRPTDPVTITAMVIDESTQSPTVRLRYRVDRSTYTSANVYPQTGTDYLSVTMADDGQHGDGAAGDGVYGAQIPSHPDGTIIEFYVEAVDAGGKVRTWPAPSLVDGQWRQVTNALYRVDAAVNPDTYWQAGGEPLYYLIMTEMERGHLALIGSRTNGEEDTDATMNGTFISVDGTSVEVCYRVGIRNRGHGTRSGPPNNFHVGFPRDALWKGLGAIGFNCRYTHAQIIGSAIFRMAGVAAADAVAAQLRINGVNMAVPGSPMFGVYVRLEAFDGDFASKHFPDDPNGNLYSCFRDNGEADLRYLGTNPNSYRPSYFKDSNVSQDDWSDLIHLVDVLNNAPDATYEQEVGKAINISQWLHYIALDSLLLNYETGLRMGIGDDYFMYRGVTDPRFVLIPHDLDTILDQGNTHGAVDQSVFTIATGVPGYNGVDGLKRFFARPEIIALYYQALLDVTDQFFRPEKLDPLLDQVLSKFTPQDRIAAMKQFAAQRRTAVLAQIPQAIEITTAPAKQDGYAHARANTASLAGKANAAKTRRVTVNGRPAIWTALQATWSSDNVSLLPGINRVVIQAFDGDAREVDRSSIDVWSEAGLGTIKAGGTLSVDETWTAAGGPYHVTGNINVPADRTLTIEPGTTVFLDASVGFTVHGRLVAQGSEYRRIRFTRVPGTTTQWAGFQIPDSKQDNIIAYADLEFGGSRSQWITTGNNNGSAVGPTARLTVDHATFSGSDTQYFSLWDPQIIIRNSVFADLGSHYMVMAERMPADGWFIVEGNLFGHCHGDTDIFHLNSVSVKGGPVARILNNVFTGGGDDIVDDNETDTHIEGNLFMHVNVGNSARSASAAVTTGTGGGSASTDNLESQHLIVVRNIFYHGDYGILNKTGAYAEIYNNVFVQNAGAMLLNEYVGSNVGSPGRAAYVENCIFWNNGPEVHGTSADNGSGTFVNPENTQLTVNNSIVGRDFLDLGTGNIDADPLLVDADRDLSVDMTLPRFSTGFPGFAEGGYLLEGMVPDVHLRPESAARGTGRNGVDMGFYAPTGASIGGVPASVTCRTDATLTVAGTDIYGYKYRVTGPGFNDTWSNELARMMRVTALTHNGVTATATVANHGLAVGDTVEIIGADRAAYNGLFTVTAITAGGFSYTLPTSVNLAHPEHLDVWARKPQVIRLTGLANGTYAVSAIKKNSMGLWQDESQPTTVTWKVDTSYRQLVLNEVLAANEAVQDHEGTFPDLVELYYDGPTTMSLAGMSLSDDPQQPDKFVFPSGTTIGAGKYLVLFADANAVTSGIHLGFALAEDGDALYLYGTDGTLVDSVTFGQQLPDLSIGRVGPAGQWQLTIPTFGQANIAYPRGPANTLKINEWLANGQVLFADDFIEIYNPHPDPVDLGGMSLTNNPVTQPDAQKIRPLTFVAGDGHAVFWADNSSDPGHLGFRLSADEGMIGLLDSQLNEVDKVLYSPQTTDVSEGRTPDGADDIELLPLPTPGVANPQLKKTTTTTVAVVGETASKRVLVPTAAVSDDWKGGRPFDDSAWTSCTGAPGGVGFETGSGYESLITLDTRAQMYGSGKNNSCYIRIPFTVAANTLADATGLTLKVLYDDGFVAYLNGKEVARANFSGTPSWNSHADSAIESAGQGFDEYIDISQFKGDLKAGSNILAVQAMNSGNTSSDFLFNAAIDAVTAKTEGQTAYGRELDLLAGLRITELMYHSSQGGSYDYIELANTSDKVIDVNGVRFSKGISFVFPAMTLQPGEYTVVVADPASFRSAYGAGPKVAGQYSSNLNNAGEEIVLQLPAPLDAAILRFSYSNTWYPSTDGGGKSLAIVDPAAAAASWDDPGSWQESQPTPGTP
jgi:hypothetical protein